MGGFGGTRTAGMGRDHFGDGSRGHYGYGRHRGFYDYGYSCPYDPYYSSYDPYTCAY
jgi:hypothetical protein